jgi:hypothetical protein
MHNPTTALLICIYVPTGKLIRRRVALTESNAVDYIYAYAERLGATVIEDCSGYSGKIVSKTIYTYDITNIAVV